MRTNALRPWKRPRGSVMLLTMFLLMFLALLGTGFMALLPVEMRSAQKDRSSVMASYAADAGVQHAMSQLKIAMNTPPSAFNVNEISKAPRELGSGWQYKIEDIVEIAPEEFRVTSVGMLRGKVQRRAVAIIDDGSDGFAIQITADDTGTSQNINQNGAWPTDVPIEGDVYVQGTWYVDNNGFNMNTPNPNPPFKGTVFQTDPSGGAMRGEKYVGSAPSSSTQYATLYTNGMDAIQPYSVDDVYQEDLVLVDQVRKSLLMGVFGTDQPSSAVTSASALTIARAPGVNIPNSKTPGTMDGGIYINPTSGANGMNNFAVEFSVQAGNGVTTVTNNGVVTRITSVTEGGTYNGQTFSADQDRLVVQKTPGGTAIYNAEFNEGDVVYINGNVTSVKGIYKGNRTVAATGDMTITGELLKSDTPRGEKPTSRSNDALGLICSFDANSSKGMSIDMPTASRPLGNEYFVYAYVTALSQTDGNAKMFSNNQHPDLPAGTSLTWVGSLLWAPTTAGQISTAMRFIDDWNKVVIDDNRPDFFPGKHTWIPRLRSYVDTMVGE